MCGICGYIHFDKTKLSSKDILRGMTDAITHRGPDDHGFYLKDNVALGHRRLAIIDLKTGHQPIYNEDRSIVVVYNGEIYNFKDLRASLSGKGHRFTTNSDTEVIVHAYEEYGEDCLKLFNGMFAFAVWDSNKDRLLLARDRFGKKPLYYAVFGNQFIFGSELKSVLKHPAVTREVDLEALGKYLAYEYVPSPYSIFKGIRKVEPASWISVKDGSVSPARQYWDIDFNPDKTFDPNAAKERLVTLLKESVRRRLISDVPLGVFLSGGIDSSAVVAMMAELMPPAEIKTFSIGFKEKSFDESSDARRVAKHFGTDHREEILSPGTMLEIFPTVLDTLDEPFADSSIIPTFLVSRFTRRHVTVALGGDGGDELFLGYPSFLAHKVNNLFRPFPMAALGRMIPTSNDYMSLNFKVKRFARGLDYPDNVRHQAWIGSFTPKEEELLFRKGLGVDCAPSRIYDSTSRFFEKMKGRTSLDKAAYVYVKTYMTDDILTKVDRASMANSLEVRAPFLDVDFAEFASTVPAPFKLRNFTTKWILKEAFKTRLPAETLSKRKQGFAVPVAKWLKEDLKGLLLAAFDKKKIEREGIFDYGYIERLMREFLANKNDTRKEIWALFMFEMWYDRWMR